MANNQPENITAEWTVHAQLTIKRPGDKSKNAADQKDSSNTADDADRKQSTNPVKVVYKWSTDDAKNDHSTKTTKNSFNKTHAGFKSETKSDTNEKVYQ